jgi:hypothetical protein
MRKLTVLVYNDMKKGLYEFLSKEFDLTVRKLTENTSTKDVDLVLFNGEESGDIHPDRYSEAVGKHTNIVSSYWEKYSYLRDYTWDYDIPKLGIDEGAQYLNVLTGGSLIQHVTGHHKSHQIYVGGFKINAPSDHHQMMYPFDLPTDHYNILGYSSYFQSDTYLDGRNQEKELLENFVEPEIISFSKVLGKGLAIQGDPGKGDEKYQTICLKLIKSILK